MANSEKGKRGPNADKKGKRRKITTNLSDLADPVILGGDSIDKKLA